jgi:protein SCO1/2/putative membrane protein
VSEIANCKLQIANCKLSTQSRRRFGNLQFAISRTLVLLCLATLLGTVSLSGCTPSSPTDASNLDPLLPVGEFALTERDGRMVHPADLQGKVWVAAFIFTRCAGPCTLLSSHMARLQQDLSGERDVVLVSFSVDPEYDTPEVLSKYADRFHADPRRWLFLTGEPKTVYDLIYNSFHLTAEPNQGAKRTPGNEVLHDTRLMLVDTQGRIRGYFDGMKIEELPRLERAIRGLLWQNRLPELNAALNGACTVLLLLGYIAIRRRWVTFHKACMLTALCVSVLFLASYLYYHIQVKKGQPTSFPGTGWVRPVYFGILLTHTVLAAVVAPLALFTAWQGWRDHLSRHVRVARWTLPLWLYVSVTGVVVYWMLYQLYPPP